MTTAELLAETIPSALRREASAFVWPVVDAKKDVVLFGSGHIGRKTAKALRSREIVPVAFADNNLALDGSWIDGIPVLSLPKAARDWGEKALFVVTNFLPSDGGMGGRLEELAKLGCSQTASFITVGWGCKGVLPHFASELPSRLLAHASELAQVESLLLDDISRETFRQQLSWRLLGEFDRSVLPAPNQYFPSDIIRPNTDEHFVDGGAFDGDTVRSAPWSFKKVTAIEPDPTNARKLRSLADGRFSVSEALLGNAPSLARFAGTGTMASCRSASGELEVRVETLDELLAEEHPTFVKLDVEGDELAALQGGLVTLKRSQPLVAVCVYHRPKDLWEIPLFLKAVLPGHRYFLRCHAWNGFELVFYAVPPFRCA